MAYRVRNRMNKHVFFTMNTAVLSRLKAFVQKFWLFGVLIALALAFDSGPDEEHWHTINIPAKELRATSQDQVRQFHSEFEICDEMIEEALVDRDFTVQEIRDNVQWGYLLDHPDDNLFGLMLVFITTYDEDDVEPLMEVVKKHFLAKFKTGKSICGQSSAPRPAE